VDWCLLSEKLPKLEPNFSSKTSSEWEAKVPERMACFDGLKSVKETRVCADNLGGGLEREGSWRIASGLRFVKAEKEL
jgi:hypothetical protein